MSKDTLFQKTQELIQKMKDNDYKLDIKELNCLIANAKEELHGLRKAITTISETASEQLPKQEEESGTDENNN